MEDKDIIALYESRSEHAIRETAEKYGVYCHIIAERILSDRLDAEECVNDTWLHTWNSIPPQKPHSLKLYVAKITRNLAFNRYKENTREKRGGGEICLVLEELAEVVCDANDIEEEIQNRELQKGIDRFLRAIAKRDAGIFLRRYFYAESCADIAKRYDIRESAVRVILSRTRQKLKYFLEKEMDIT